MAVLNSAQDLESLYFRFSATGQVASDWSEYNKSRTRWRIGKAVAPKSGSGGLG